MALNDAKLGGRIALVEPGTPTETQRTLYQTIAKDAVPWPQSCRTGRSSDRSPAVPCRLLCYCLLPAEHLRSTHS